MLLQYFTLIHILISLVGIASGFGTISGLLAAKVFPRWAAVFLATTAATGLTGFFFPFNGVTPAIVVSIISLLLLALAGYALYLRQLAGAWRKAFVITAVMSLYFNVFVLVVQLFQKMPALVAIAPTQSEPPFAITQALVLVIFVALGIVTLKTFRSESTVTSE